LTLALALPAIAQPAAVVSPKSVVLFNTECARCHEGECSGRMTFHLPREAADTHIRRFGGEVSTERLGELFGLLRHMKESCAFHPLPLPLVRDGHWDGKILAGLRSP